MKLIKSKEQAAQLGMPASRREWWDIGNGYEVSIAIETKISTLNIYSVKKDITLDVARLLGIDTKPEDITFKPPMENTELYLVPGIDCVGLNYLNPKNYKNLLSRIEAIVNEKFKHK